MKGKRVKVKEERGQGSDPAPMCVPEPNIEDEGEDEDERESRWGGAALSPLTFHLSPCSICRTGRFPNIYEKT